MDELLMIIASKLKEGLEQPEMHNQESTARSSQPAKARGDSQCHGNKALYRRAADMSSQWQQETLGSQHGTLLD